MPGLVTSMDVAPPMRTENSGIKVIENRFDLLSLGEIGIPFLLFFQGGLLAQCGKRDLASPVFNYFSPDFFGLEARFCDRLLQRRDNLPLSSAVKSSE